MKTLIKTPQEQKIIGARFRSARSLVPTLNRKSFCEKYGINRYTVQSWENGLHISKGKNIEKFIEALGREGVFCTAEWLIDGKGEPAQVAVETYNLSSNKPSWAHNNEHLNAKVLEISEEMGDDIIAHRITDNTMAPKFLAGDLVLGQKIDFSSDMAHQKYCVIKLNHDKLLVRRVLLNKDGLWLIACDERIPGFFLGFDCDIYKIVWHMLSQ